ncbi:glycoside hydrolase family 92 protein [Elizabethkingia argentiflava]|uniref:Glycoside hydrolase family 92 protein n=1 Tax=Elizabethkingia argenteiflava TaxID=2681556 RepID=A0A845PYR9_9FLAO|nr:GH92 family glycosyl hydrolase [Elizabethkingia argenteiflava]NAW51508.1 glycoside hydrolase family 92 protein [Elizabethkingia argenteiflava]
MHITKLSLTLFTLIFYYHSQAQKNVKLISYVHPLIGTEKMGHTYPGAASPFGAVQLSPETDTISYDLNGKYNHDVYKYCSGYRYEDKTIIGFSHAHFSGTGHSDLGDFLVMPTVGKLRLNPGTATHPEKGYRSRFSHTDEKSEAGYYKVKLNDYNVLAELTATPRVGVHRYTFPKTDQAHIILNLIAGIYNYSDKNIWTYVRFIDNQSLTGYRQTNGWARTRTVYFAMKFSKAFKTYGQQNNDHQNIYKGFWRKFDQNKNFPEIAGKQVRLYFDFTTQQGEAIEIRLAISPVSQKNALENLEKESTHLSFDQIRKQTQEDWNKELNRILIEGTEDQKINFYTAMYHAFISPNLYMDSNSEYRGLDQNIHKAADFTNYTTFSLWDTYRALHPLFNIIQPKRNNDMLKSMMAHYDQFSMKMLPIWSHYANENWCMSGYHSVSLLADAIIKGNYNGDAEAALQACIATANKRNYEGIGDYIDKGYIPAENNATSVSNTLEYAYDDWAIAQLAKHLGKTKVYHQFMKRSENWKNNFDQHTGFMRPRLSNGHFKKDFNPLDTHEQGFIEGNSWNYSFFVPQDPHALIQYMGGQEKFSAKLDTLFFMHLPDKFFAKTQDITREGIVGGYIHGNEPAHHVAYLYNWSNQAWKTQRQVRHILEKQYKPTPDGLGGNDDTGQMSAWYILSSLGFYPVAPGSEDYAIGSPAIERAILYLENGNKFEIEALDQKPEHVYVRKILINGKELKNFSLKHSEMMKGGKLTFYMSNKPQY